MAANNEGKIKRAPDLSKRPEPDFDLINQIADRAPVHPRPSTPTRKAKTESSHQQPKSFRLRQEDKTRLADITSKVSAESGRKISETTIIRALILIADGKDIKPIVNAVLRSVL